MALTRLAPSVLLFILCAMLAAQDRRELVPPVSLDEYRVLAAALDFFQSSNLASHPLVADHTSTFQCGASPCNGMRMGDCNGLRGKDETMQERLRIVKRDLPDLETITIAQFEKKNQTCSELGEEIPTKSKYFLFSASRSPLLPTGWEHSDFFYFSRVAFNEQQTQALLDIGFMSGTDGSNSGGKYFLFVKNKEGEWKVKGTSAVWQLNP